MTQKMKPLYFTFPIERVNDEQRIVEGYAFVNEVVEGEGGVRLKRSAMEAATPDYLRNGTVRAMHQPIAAGKPLDVTWDVKGAYLRAKIVDDQEWEKVKEGVYKGFSIGVKPQEMRGLDVEVCGWWDSSLVDIGKDREALFALWRSESYQPDAEFEVEVIEREEPVGTRKDEWSGDTVQVPLSFNAKLDALRESDLNSDLWDAFYALSSVLSNICACDPPEGTDRASLMSAALDQFAAYCKTEVLSDYAANASESRAYLDAVIQRVDSLRNKKMPEENTSLLRMQELETSNAALVTRLEGMAADLAKVPGLEQRLQQAEERITMLAKTPVPLNAPVRFPDALERTLAAQINSSEGTEQATTLTDELTRLEQSLQNEPDPKKREEGVVRIGVLKQQLSTLNRQG